MRVLPDNFYGLEQAIIVNKGETAKLAAVNKLIDETRTTGLIPSAIEGAGLKGVDVAPAGSSKRGVHWRTPPMVDFQSSTEISAGALSIAPDPFPRRVRSRCNRPDAGARCPK